VRALVAGGHEAVGLARSPDKDAVIRAAGGTPVRGDILSIPALVEAAKGCEALVHAAAAATTASREIGQSVAAKVRVDGAYNLVAAARKAVRVPLTVKFRLGLDSARANYLELGRICQEEGADAVALHARTARQMFSGQPDRERIRLLKDALRIPVSGNGDIETPEDAVALWRDTGCDGVMIGRAAIKNPWIFRQIAQRRAGRPAHQPTLEERRDLIAWHFGLLRERETEEFALHKIRTFTGWYTHGLPNGRALRQKINSLPSTAHFMDALEQFFAEAIATPADTAGSPLVSGTGAPALALTAQTA